MSIDNNHNTEAIPYMTLHEVRIDITLAELAATMDAALGRETGMAAILDAWVVGTEIATQLKAGSPWLATYARTLGKLAVKPEYRPPGVLSSTNVAMHHPEGWAAASYSSVFARLGGPDHRRLPAPLVSRNNQAMKAELLGQRRECRESNRLRRDALVSLMDEAGWDETTRLTRDGYRIGRDTNTVFSLRRYRELYPTDADRPEALRQSTGEVFSCVTPVRGR
jgi:hypothetical protein